MTRVGWCPGGRTVTEMLAMYRGTRVVRIFVGPGKPLPAWDGPILGPLVAAGAAVHLSYKTNPLSEVLPWAGRKPAGVLLWLSEDHEPEQGPDAGDPTLEEFHASQAALVAAFDGHPMRDEIWLGPVYTRYWWQKVAGDRRWWPRVPVDFIGWDIYSDDGYRTPDDLLSIPRQVAAETGVPYLIAELGAKPGTGRAAWMRAMVDAAKADGALTVCWFHKDDWVLTGDPDQQTWQTIITEEAPVATTAPQNLLDARALLQQHLRIESAALGIVGDPAHRGGYHCGEDRVVPNDYSVVESSRDRTGLAKWACALDVGQFRVTTPKGTFDLPHYSRWLAAQCAAGTDDTRDIREVIYSPDGKTVRRWDRLGRRSSGDSSHLFHTHQSYFRDAIRAGRDQTAVIRRYLTEIGLIEGDDTMDRTEFIEHFKAAMNDPTVAALMKARPWQYPVTEKASALNVLFAQQLPQLAAAVKGLGEAVARESSSPDEIRALLDAMPKPEPLDVDGIAERLKASLPASTAISDEQLKRVLRDLLGSLDGATPQT